MPVEVVRSMGAALDRGKEAAPCCTGSGIVGRLLVRCPSLAPLRQHNGSGGRCVGIVQGCVGHAAPANPTILRGALRILPARKTPRGIPQYRFGANLTQRSLHADSGGHSVSALLAQGVADSTRRVYASGQRRYSEFCERVGLTPFPADKQTASLFCANLAKNGLRYSTIKTYLAGLRFAQISSIGVDPLAGSLPKLYLALAGIKRAQGRPAPDPRLPVTPAILRQFRAAWTPYAHLWDFTMLWAACCLGFFGFLRSGEFTLPCREAFDQRRHLSPAVDSVANPSLIRIHLKESKADPYKKGVDIVIGRTDTDICPVGALLAYLARRDVAPGPLFVFENGSSLSRTALVDHVRAALR